MIRPGQDLIRDLLRDLAKVTKERDTLQAQVVALKDSVLLLEEELTEAGRVVGWIRC